MLLSEEWFGAQELGLVQLEVRETGSLQVSCSPTSSIVLWTAVCIWMMVTYFLVDIIYAM